MSRFATPSRSRIPVVAVQPAIPVQREPGFKYEKGLSLPGASIKGKHAFEIYVDGQRQTRPIDSRQPTSADYRDPNFNADESQFLPLSSRKRFEKPEKEDRTARRKSPTPVTSRPTTPNRAATTSTVPIGGGGNVGLMVNAEVVRIGDRGSSPPGGRLSSGGSVAGSVMSTQSLRSHRSHSSSSLASRSVGTAKSGGSYYYSLSGKGSVRDKLAHRSDESVLQTIANRSITPNRLAYNQSGNSAISVSGNSQQTGRSLTSKSRLSSSLHGNQIENLTSSDMHLQLSQSSYKTVRKAIIRNNFRKFLEDDEEEIDVTEDKQQARGNAGTGPASPMKELMSNLLQFDEADYPAAVGSPSGNQSTTGGQLSQAKKKELKKHTKIMKMTNALRQSIQDDLKQFHVTTAAHQHNGGAPSSSGSVATVMCAPQDIFFPTTNNHPQAFTSLVRQDILNVVGNWQHDFMQFGISALDQHYRTYVERLQTRNSVIEQYQELVQKRNSMLEERTQLKYEMADLVREAEDMGVNLRSLLSRYPAEWFDAVPEEATDEVTSVVEKMSNSVFLQPNLIHQSNQEEGDDEGDGDERGRTSSLDYEQMDTWQHQMLPHSNYYHNQEGGNDDESTSDPTRSSTGQRIKYQELMNTNTPLYTSKLEQTPPPPPPTFNNAAFPQQRVPMMPLPSPTTQQKSPPWKVNFEVIKALSSK